MKNGEPDKYIFIPSYTWCRIFPQLNNLQEFEIRLYVQWK